MKDIIRLWEEEIRDVNAAAAVTVYSDYVKEGYIYYAEFMSIQHDNGADANFIYGIENDGVKLPISNDSVTTGAGYVDAAGLYTFIKPGDRIYIDIPALTAGKYARFIIRGLMINAESFMSGAVFSFMI